MNVTLKAGMHSVRASITGLTAQTPEELDLALAPLRAEVAGVFHPHPYTVQTRGTQEADGSLSMVMDFHARTRRSDVALGDLAKTAALAKLGSKAKDGDKPRAPGPPPDHVQKILDRYRKAGGPAVAMPADRKGRVGRPVPPSGGGGQNSGK